MTAGPGGKVVAVLGGAGGMGRHAAVAATRLTGVERVRIADRDRAAARRVAAACGPRAEAVELDVADDTALRAALGEADLVLSAIGPYFRFGPPVLRAAIESRCDYLDLCDDPDPTVAMLDLSAAAARAGVRAIVGIGASPGVVNLLAVLAMRELDEVRRVVTGWNGEGATPEPGSGPAAIEHGIAQATGTIPVVRDGIERRSGPCAGSRSTTRGWDGAAPLPSGIRSRSLCSGPSASPRASTSRTVALASSPRSWPWPDSATVASSRSGGPWTWPASRSGGCPPPRLVPWPPRGACRPCSPWPRGSGAGLPPRWGWRWRRCRERAWGR